MDMPSETQVFCLEQPGETRASTQQISYYQMVNGRQQCNSAATTLSRSASCNAHPPLRFRTGAQRRTRRLERPNRGVWILRLGAASPRRRQ